MSPVDPDDPIAAFMFLTDPPEHTRLRRQVSRAFTERRIAGLREYATSTAQDLVRSMLAVGDGADLQSAFAYPLPIAVISELLGIPDAGRDKFRRWADIVLRSAGLPDDEVYTGFEELRRFVIDVVDAKPDGADLLSQLVVDSGEGDGLSRAEINAMALGLLMAGYITTAHAITTGVVRLMLRRDFFTGLTERTVDPAAVVEELLRCQDEEIGIQRIAQRDVEFRGALIKHGDTIVVSRVGANRDPDVFGQGDQVRPGGDNGRAHLTFGFGPHHCLGAALARMELTVALVTLATMLPTLELAAPLTEIGWQSDGMDISLRSLPVRW
ncbi:cytochrome P450 [Amycolatopsis sp. A1MSW2902]|uniref:cytochrome P450 n=1 Tax=Amycolatopsis sp. A1MSW2902 TaxID=687413 RepID=UPI00307ECCC6